MFLLLPLLVSTMPTPDRGQREPDSFVPRLNFPEVVPRQPKSVRDDEFMGLFSPEDDPEHMFEKFVVECFICQEEGEKDQQTPVEENLGRESFIHFS